MRSLLTGFTVFVLVAVLTQYLAYQQYQISQEAERQKAVHEISTVKERLTNSLSYSLSATGTLAFLVRALGVPADFDSVASDILESNKFIDALQLTRKGVITHVYPLQGNEAAIGYDVLKDSLRSPEAYRAIEKKEIFFAGPFELKQGGVAVVGRLPIFIESEFWGFSVVLIKFSTLLNAAGIDTAQSNRFVYQLSKVNPFTGEEEFFLPETFPVSKGEFVSIDVPDGEWKLYVAPRNRPANLLLILTLSALGLVLSVTGGVLTWHLMRQPQHLAAMVEQKTFLQESIINSLPGIFYLYDRTGRFVRWNKNFEIISGYSSEEVSRMHPLDFFDDDEKALLTKRIEKVFTDGSADVTANFYTKDKRKIPCYFNGRRTTLDGNDYLIGMGIDITDRVAAEEELVKRTKEIEELTMHLQRVREEERTRISREIHDELGQQLTGLKMDVSWVSRKAGDERSVQERLSAMVSLIDETMKTVRRISSELRPGILDDLGLIPALEWQAQEFGKRTGIESLFSTDLKELNLERELSTNIFRIYQETLTNVARHANATRVHAALEQRNGNLRLVVQDNGQGFDTEGVKTKNSLGLIGMKERARSFQGNLSIVSNRNSGTIIILETPLKTVSL